MPIKDNEDAALILVNTLETILKISAEVYAIVEGINSTWSPRDSFHRFKREKGFDWDMFTLCTMAVDNGIIEIVSGLLAANVTFSESRMVLGADGSVLIQGANMVIATTVELKELATPTPAVRQIGLVTQTAQLVPQFSSFVRNAVDSITAFVQKEEPKLEEL
jgi:hypothetical protein